MEQNAKLLPDPAMNPGDEAYFEAAKEGRLLVKQCRGCDKVHHYPRALCPFCWSEDVEWLDASGMGEIYTYSIMRRGESYCIAYVRLLEGPTIMTNIVDCDLDTVRIGDAVRVVFKPTESGGAIPMFTLDSTGGRP
nr:Zn-ribbon domain-containing OB-fold protein [Bordetella sp. N]